MRTRKNNTKNGCPELPGTTSLPEHFEKSILLTAHAGPVRDFLEAGGLPSRLALFSLRDTKNTEESTFTACYVSIENTYRQLNLFGTTGSPGMVVPGWKKLDPRRLSPTMSSNTSSNKQKMKPGSSSERRSVQPDGLGDWYEFDDQGIAIPKE